MFSFQDDIQDFKTKYSTGKDFFPCLTLLIIKSKLEVQDTVSVHFDKLYFNLYNFTQIQIPFSMSP